MRERFRAMDACFANSLEAHWTCTDEVKTSEAKQTACIDESEKYEQLLETRWARNGPGVTEARKLIEDKQKEDADLDNADDEE